MSRGYFGVACYRPKTTDNIGTLWRSAHIFGASFLAVIGGRYHKQPSDTTAATRHVPLLSFDDFAGFRSAMPTEALLIAVELVPNARPLTRYTHAERAVYLLGPEDGSLPNDVVMACDSRIIIPGSFCLNLAVAGSIVLYDRVAKSARDHIAQVWPDDNAEVA